MSTQASDSCILEQQNLIPVYLIEDKLKQNFHKTNSFIKTTQNRNLQINHEIEQLKTEQNNIKQSFSQKMKEMERKIVNEISSEIEGRIAVALGKSIQSFTDKIDKRQSEMANFQQDFNKKITSLKQQIKYQVTQDNQKYFSKEMKKMQNNMSTTKTRESKAVKTNKPEGQHTENQDWQAQHLLIQQLEERVEKIQAFNIDLDKKFYSNMSSLKESWKQLGSQMLENKKSLNKKFDDLRVEFLKLKTLKQFSIAPQKMEDQFKKRLMDKFTDIYQLLGLTLTKNEYESSNERMNKKLNRHDEEFMEVRKQLSNNSEFFTFYMNNSDQEDLKKQITIMHQQVQQQKQTLDRKMIEFGENHKESKDNIKQIQKNLQVMNENFEREVRSIERINETVGLFDGRIQNLQDFNRFGPDKLQKIHNSLDVGFSPSQQELIRNQTKKTYSAQVQQLQKEFKIQMSKFKDQLFILASQTQVKDQQILALKKIISQMDNKIDKVKGQTEEAMISRKPWVCLSCDKQEKQKQTKKQMKGKKIDSFRQGLGQQKGSEKNLRLSNQPTFEERFEVYQKFRQKYLSDTVKLPQIYKEKVGDKDISFH